MTKPRSVSGILRANEVMKVTMLTPEAQLKKTIKNREKLRKQIDRLKHEKNSAGIDPGRMGYIELAINSLEKKLTKTIISAMALEGKSEKSHLRFLKKKEDDKKAEEIRKANAAKVKAPEVQKYGKSTRFNPHLSGKGQIKEYVVVNAGKRKVSRKWTDK